MGDLLGNLLLSILAIILPPVAALIKVFITHLNESLFFFLSNIYLGWMYNTFLD